MDKNNRLIYSFIGIVAVLSLLLFMLFPEVGIEASVRGLGIWWEVLFPALLPFIVISELMLGVGIVHYVGTILDPLMRPLFRVSGKGGFIMVMGFASGYPVAARLTARLLKQKLITREEGERLVSFTTTADPIFLIGAVAVGFFHDPSLALILALAHYIGALLTGGIMRFHGKAPLGEQDGNTGERPIWERAWIAMRTARAADGRDLGTMLMEAIASGLKLVFVIGGLVVFFCVWIELLRQIGIIQWLTYGFAGILSWSVLQPELAPAFVNGLFEVTIGAKEAASYGHIADKYKAATAAFILSWAGLSVHAQVVSLLSQTGIRYGPFFVARIFHAIFSMLIVFIGWGFL